MCKFNCNKQSNKKPFTLVSVYCVNRKLQIDQVFCVTNSDRKVSFFNSDIESVSKSILVIEQRPRSLSLFRAINLCVSCAVFSLIVTLIAFGIILFIRLVLIERMIAVQRPVNISDDMDVTTQLNFPNRTDGMGVTTDLNFPIITSPPINLSVTTTIQAVWNPI